MPILLNFASVNDPMFVSIVDIPSEIVFEINWKTFLSIFQYFSCLLSGWISSSDPIDIDLDDDDDDDEDNNKDEDEDEEIGREDEDDVDGDDVDDDEKSSSP